MSSLLKQLRRHTHTIDTRPLICVYPVIFVVMRDNELRRTFMEVVSCDKILLMMKTSTIL